MDVGCVVWEREDNGTQVKHITLGQGIMKVEDTGWQEVEDVK